MSTVRELHHQAMELASLAFLARHAGDLAQAQALARQALPYEVAAAEQLVDQLDEEPTRSLLYRSAASLAMQGGEFAEAERLIEVGLAGHSPPAIAAELHELLDQIQMQRRLA